MDTLTKLNRKIEKNNAKFQELAPAEKRVKIAKDVVKQLEDKKLRAESGTYFALSGKGENLKNCLLQKVEDPNLAQVTMSTKCTVCGIGALFVAAIENDGSVELQKGFTDYHIGQREIHNQLKPYFTAKQLKLIEAFFERDLGFSHGRYFGGDYGTNSETINEFQKHEIVRERSAQKRLAMIMENIIENDGEFKPFGKDSPLHDK